MDLPVASGDHLVGLDQTMGAEQSSMTRFIQSLQYGCIVTEYICLTVQGHTHHSS